MTPNKREDSELLRQYVDQRSEEAFTQLVSRYVSLVYFAALRRVGGDTHLADDVTQSVFTDLARKAPSLMNRPILTGWLYTSTRFAAAQAVRSARRRRTHEEEAHIMQELQQASEGNWEQLRPVIDEALDELGERDRELVLLRYFENRPFAELGDRFSLSPDAARMKVERALDKLRVLLARRGVVSTAAAMAAVFAGQSGLAAPVGLATRIASTVFSQTTGVAVISAFSLWKVLSGVAIVGLGAGVIIHQVRQSPTQINSSVSENAAEKPQALAGSAVFVNVAVPEPVVARIPAAVRFGHHRSTVDFGWPLVSLFAGEGDQVSAHTFAEFHTKMAEDAEFREVVAAQARDRLDLFYGHLFQTLSLPADQLDRFKDLLVEKQRLKLDIVEAQQDLGYPRQESSSVFHDSVNVGQQNLDAEIAALLGDSGYVKYLQYREDLVQWTAVNKVTERLRSTASPLTDEQAGRLVVLLRGSLLRIRYPYTFDIGFGAGLFPAHIGSGLTDRAILQAGKIISPDQLEALRELRRSAGKPPPS